MAAFNPCAICCWFHVCRFVQQASVAASVAVVGCSAAATVAAKEPMENQWTQLFDGKKLGKWEVIEKYDFKRHGEVNVTDGRILLGAGSPGTGVRWSGDFPRMNYEVTLQAMRVKGGDFFCGMTFPVGEKALTLVIGGWGGSVTGLSSIDGEPAVENETCQYIDFKQGRWYAVRVKVTEPMIEVWLDGERVVELKTENREFSIYWEVEPCLPFGIATWRTTGALRDIRVRSFAEAPSDQRRAAGQDP